MPKAIQAADLSGWHVSTKQNMDEGASPEGRGAPTRISIHDHIERCPFSTAAIRIFTELDRIAWFGVEKARAKNIEVRADNLADFAAIQNRSLCLRRRAMNLSVDGMPFSSQQ
jgi:hypothetical protein